MHRVGRARRAAAAVTILVVAAGCGAQDIATEAIVDNALEDSGVEVAGLGREIPEGFPAEIPLPVEGVELESAIGAAGTYAIRYRVTDPVAAVAAYRTLVDEAGLTIETDFNNIGGAGNNVGFIAKAAGWDINVAAFPEQPVDGLYMAVAVTPSL